MFVSLLVGIIVIAVAISLIGSGSSSNLAIGVGLIAFYVWMKIKPGWKIHAKLLEYEEILERHR